MDNGQWTYLSWSCELNCLHLVFIIINNVMGGKLKISTSAVEPIPIYNYGSNHSSDKQRIKPGEITSAIVGKRLHKSYKQQSNKDKNKALASC